MAKAYFPALQKLVYGNGTKPIDADAERELRLAKRYARLATAPRTAERGTGPLMTDPEQMPAASPETKAPGGGR